MHSLVGARRRRGALAIVAVAAVVFTAAGCGGDDDSGSAATGSGADKTYKVKLAWVFGGPGVPANDASHYFAEEVKKRSNGRVTFTEYPNGQLGDPQQEFAQIRSGAVQMGWQGWSQMAAAAPKATVFNLPFLFPSRDGAYNVLDGETGSAIKDQLLQETGVRVLTMWDGGFASPANNKRPIKSAADFKGLKMRTIDNPLIIDTYKTLGAEPVAIAPAELPTAVQNGTVDGFESTPTDIVTFKLGPQTKYYTITNQNFFGQSLLINEKFFKSLPADLQKIFTDVAKEAEQMQREQQQKNDEKSLAQLKTEGMQVYEMPADGLADLAQAVSGVYDKEADVVGADFVDSAKAEAQQGG